VQTIYLLRADLPSSSSICDKCIVDSASQKIGQSLILDYGKKEKWLATQMAWFARFLKDDPSWWEALYPKKHL
jgi:hypothetical protein